MKFILFIMILLFVSIASEAALSNFWVTAGGVKQPQEDVLPKVNCTTCTISRNWDGTTASFFSAKGEAIGFALYMGNNTGANIAGVNVQISSFSGVSAGIVSTATLITGVTNYANPIEVFYVRYLPIDGMTQLSWDGTEVDQRDAPERFRRPCTVNVNGTCVANGGTLWTDRPDNQKHLPEILVPYEAVVASSFTVYASSSQAIWFDVWVDTRLPAGTYTSQITVKEGVSVSTRIPVSLTVNNFTLPDIPSKKAITYITPYNINYRHQNEHFPATPGSGVYLQTRQNYAKMLHRHKFSAIIGSNCCTTCGSTLPCPEFAARLNGSLYSPASGYTTGPGVGIGDRFMSIGTYGNWPSPTWSSSTVAGANGFCTNVDAWSTAMSAYPACRPFLYLSDEPASLVNTEKWANWMSTACTMPGATINSMATASWADTKASAAHLNLPVSTTFLRASSATWQTASDYYQTVGTTQAWIYNSHPSATGSVFATEDDGIAPVTIFWAMQKKNVPTWFGWSADYWTDSNNSGQPNSNDNDIFNKAKTFGYDLWDGVTPSSSPTKGHTGFGYSNGDGVLLYPGHDISPNATSDYGFDGPIASWRLKMLRRGIQDADYMALAAAVNPSATSAIVNSMVPRVLWEQYCFDSLDCTYAYGGRSWTNEASAWEDAREDLSDIITAQTSQPVVVGKEVIRGRVTIRARVQFK